MADELELLGLELAREIRICREELLKKRELVVSLTKSQASLNDEIEELTAKLKQSIDEVQEVKAQLQVRSEATQRLEQENANLRDTVARLQVQVDSNAAERDRLLKRWQMAETERASWKEKCEQLEEAASESAAFKEQCLLLQNQLRNTVAKIMSQQEIVQKEYAKVERAAQDSLLFANTVSRYTKHQETEAKNLIKVVEESEKKLLELSIALDDMRRERDQLLRNQDYESTRGSYASEWKRYQQDMKRRIEGFVTENERLLEELRLAREQTDDPRCQQCQKQVPKSLS